MNKSRNTLAILIYVAIVQAICLTIFTLRLFICDQIGTHWYMVLVAKAIVIEVVHLIQSFADGAAIEPLI